MYIYTVEVTEKELLELMQLVMKYGTGTGYGDGSLSIGARVALADATKRYKTDPLVGVCDTNVDV